MKSVWRAFHLVCLLLVVSFVRISRVVELIFRLAFCFRLFNLYYKLHKYKKKEENKSDSDEWIACTK